MLANLNRRRRPLAAAVAILAVLANLTAPAQASAAPPGYTPRPITSVKPVAVRDVSPTGFAGPSSRPHAARPAAVWPAAGPAGIATGTTRSGARARVEVLDEATTAKAGVQGVLMRAESTMDLTVDYRTFRWAYGGGWASRLRLVSLPECALSTPDAPGCRGTVLPSKNNAVAGTVTAPVTAGLVALAAGPSGPLGDYAATPLQPSSAWSAGGSSGGFSWSYPMRVPPAPGGLAPNVSLSYSSQSVDGKHAASNNQPSWAGEGFEAWPGGFIERRYIGCADDMDGSANNNEKTGDLCWETSNAVLSLDGHSGELIFNASEDRWHLRSDDGSKIERRTGAGNGDNDGEHWVVTTTDGTQYWFGLNRLPGWTTGDPLTNSTWTVPVFGNDPNEPCHATAFADSHCLQAWRWNLDYVVDVHGNSASSWYAKETNKYGRNLKESDAAGYDRGGRLDHIAYGTRRVAGVESVLDTPSPMQVVFDTADRCVTTNCGTHDEANWPDTPWDQQCTGAPCDDFSPTFWTTRRLSTITTQVRTGSAYSNVERWTLSHSFPDPGDTELAGLWLTGIAHEGLVGGTTSLPSITFTGGSMDNRVDGIDHSSAMAWFRITRIDTEAGGAIAVTYSGRDCQAGQPKPTPQTNTRRCYHVRWTPPGFDNPIDDWFHKYVVTEVRQADMVGGGPEVVTRYSYLGNPAWHYADDDGIIEPKNKTWSVWRGYGTVGVTVGEPGEQTYKETRYFRGMHGDRATPTGGTRSVAIDGINDEDWYAGMTRETKTFNGPGGPGGPGGAVVSRQTNDPWASAATASRTINGDLVTARFTRVATTRDYATLDGSRGERVTRATTTFDGRGMATKVDDFGQDGVSGDEQCTLTTFEPRNTDLWLLDKPHRVQKFGVACAAAATPATLTDDDVISDVRTSYDTHAWGVVPTAGNATRQETASAWNAGSPTFVTTSTAVFDAHGRTTELRDALGNPTTTTYMPLVGGPVTGHIVKNALDHETTTTLNPAWGLATRVVDANGKRTDLAYDGLGRLTAVWLPGRTAPATANATFAYDVRKTGVSSVTASRRNPQDTGWLTTYTLHDGLLRTVQTQSPSPADGGRIVTNSFFDSAGRAKESYGNYYATGAPGTTLVVPIEPLNVPDQTRIVYDGAGRTTASIFEPYNVERWRTGTYYAGDRADVTPPAGGTATSTVTDARGRTVALRQFLGATPTGAYDQTTYTFNRKSQLTRVTDPLGNHWDYTFDLRGRQITASDPDEGVTTSAYDDAGRLASTVDSRNIKLVYTYDSLGRKTAVYQNWALGTPRARWLYDSAAKGQLDQSVRNVGTDTYVVKVTGYNDFYQPTGHEIVIPASETGLAGTYQYTYSFNNDGSAAASSYPAIADLPVEAVHTEYGPVGLPSRLSGVYGVTNLSYVSAAAYDALGRPAQTTLYTGSGNRVNIQPTYEVETGRLTNLFADRQAVAPYTVVDVGYSYDNAGNIISAKDNASTPADNQCFKYDYLRRLTEAWTPSSGSCATAPTTAGLGGPAPYWLSWTYDKIGNRLSQVAHTTAGNTVTSYTYPAAGSPKPHTLTSTSGGQTGSYAYDAAGNSISRPAAGGTQTLTWNPEGHLATTTDQSGQNSYVYDADGNRLISHDPAGATLFLPGQELRYTNASQSRSGTRYYTFGTSTIASRTGSGLSWLINDHQGTQGVVIDAVSQAVTQRRQTPFGTARGTAPAWPNTKSFVGGTKDATALVHLGAREYDPSIGRFISLDQIMDLQDPQQTHGYTYADNSPFTKSDPTGLKPICGDRPGDPCEKNGGGSSGGGSSCAGSSVTACEHKNGSDEGYGSPKKPKFTPWNPTGPKGPWKERGPKLRKQRDPCANSNGWGSADRCQEAWAAYHELYRRQRIAYDDCNARGYATFDSDYCQEHAEEFGLVRHCGDAQNKETGHAGCAYSKMTIHEPTPVHPDGLEHADHGGVSFFISFTICLGSCLGVTLSSHGASVEVGKVGWGADASLGYTTAPHGDQASRWDACGGEGPSFCVMGGTTTTGELWAGSSVGVGFGWRASGGPVAQVPMDH